MKTPRNSSQDARDLNRWERGQGIDQNQESGHKYRPPSSAKNAAEMEKKHADNEHKEYKQWLWQMRNDPPWKDDGKTPTQKVQDVTHPIGEEVGMEAIEQLLKNSGATWSKGAAHGLGGLGILADIFGNPDKAW